MILNEVGIFFGLASEKSGLMFDKMNMKDWRWKLCILAPSS